MGRAPSATFYCLVTSQLSDARLFHVTSATAICCSVSLRGDAQSISLSTQHTVVANLGWQAVSFEYTCASSGASTKDVSMGRHCVVTEIMFWVWLVSSSRDSAEVILQTK